MSEPRQEFWIYDLDKDGECIKATPIMQRGFVPSDKDIRVIEFQAYQELQEKLKVAEEALEYYYNVHVNNWTIDFNELRKVVTEALAKIRGEG